MMVTGKGKGVLWMAEVMPGLLKTGRIFPVRRWMTGTGSKEGGFLRDSGSGRGGGVHGVGAMAMVTLVSLVAFKSRLARCFVYYSDLGVNLD